MDDLFILTVAGPLLMFGIGLATLWIGVSAMATIFYSLVWVWRQLARLKGRA